MKKEDIKLIYAKKLKSLRLSHSLTQQEMADKFKMSQQSYAKMESGMITLSFERINQICSIFKILYNDFIIIEPTRKKKNKTNINDYETTILKANYEKLLAQKDIIINELELKLLQFTRGKSQPRKKT